jgi:hypothetical protein
MQAASNRRNAGTSRRSGTFGRTGGGSLRRIGRQVATAAPLFTLVGLTGCFPSPVETAPTASPPAPFVRAPYVQNVSPDSASVLWMSSEEATDSVRYRKLEPAAGDGQTNWSRAVVEDRGRGVRLARLGGLTAASETAYEVFTGSTSAGVSSFRTAPGSMPSEPVRALLFGDSGWGSEEQVQLARGMERMDWDLSIHVGDIAYYDGSETDFTERHFKVYRRMLAEVPFYPSVGNHDVRADGGASYDRAFDWPTADPGSRYYAFRWGSVQFVALDTSSDSPDVDQLWVGKGRQYDWLERILRSASRDTTVDWIVVFGHHPPYSHAVGISGHGPNRDLRVNLPPLFERYGVDLVASGHDHHYERFRPIRRGKPVADGCGPVYVIQGAGGASRYARDVARSEFTAAASRAFSFTELSFVGDRIRGRTIGTDGGVIDEFTLRPYDGPEAAGCDD